MRENKIKRDMMENLIRTVVRGVVKEIENAKKTSTKKKSALKQEQTATAAVAPVTGPNVFKKKKTLENKPLEEMTTTVGGTPGYNIPGAFSKEGGSKAGVEGSEKIGYTLTNIGKEDMEQRADKLYESKFPRSGPSMGLGSDFDRAQRNYDAQMPPDEDPEYGPECPPDGHNMVIAKRYPNTDVALYRCTLCGATEVSEAKTSLEEKKQYSTEELQAIWDDDEYGEYIQLTDDGAARYIAHGMAREEIIPPATEPMAGRQKIRMIRQWCQQKNFWPNIWHVNERGNIELVNPRTGDFLGGLVETINPHLPKEDKLNRAKGVFGKKELEYHKEAGVWYVRLESPEDQCPPDMKEFSYTTTHVPTGNTVSRKICCYNSPDFYRLTRHWNSGTWECRPNDNYLPH